MSLGALQGAEGKVFMRSVSVVWLDTLAVALTIALAHLLPLASQGLALLWIELLVTLFGRSQALLFLAAEGAKFTLALL